MLALALAEQGRLDEAAQAAEAARRRGPVDRAALNLAASIALRRRRPQEAQLASERALSLDPHDQRALSDLILAYRMSMQEAPALRLADAPGLVRLASIGTPPGFASVEAFNRTLAQAIAAHPGLSRPRPDATMTGGGRLTDLSALPPAMARALQTLLAEAADAYGAGIDAAPDHPVRTGQPSGRRLVGWANVFGPGDFERPHIHEAGWVSGVYYAQMPAAGGDILLGGHHHRDLPGAVPTRRIRPEAGQILLFPSYLHHQTEAFEGPGRRVNVAFDILRDESPSDLG